MAAGSIWWQVAWPVAAAWAAGGLIGFERSYHGRAAGFRTHALIALAGAAAMMIAVGPGFDPTLYPAGVTRLDPTRVAQGMLAGIGFLGAGVIFKEGVNVHGLTTAASLYATAVIGLLFGAGSGWAAVLATCAVVTTLLFLRWVEMRLPAHFYAAFDFGFRAADAPTQAALEQTLSRFGISVRAVSFARSQGGAVLQFSGDLITRNDKAFDDLAAYLRDLSALVEFEVTRISK